MNAEVLKKKLGLQGKKISDLPTTNLTDSTEVEVSNYGVSGKVAFGFIKELFTTKGMYIHQELYSTLKGVIEAIPEDKITLGMKVRFHSDKDTWEEYEYTGKNIRSIRNSDYWRKTENTEKVFEYIKEAVSKFEDKHSLCCISYKPSKIKVTCDVKKDSGCGCAKPFRIGDSIYIINEDGETEWLYDIIDTSKEEPKAPNKYRVTITYNDFGYYTNTLPNDTAEFEEGTVLRFDASPKTGFRVKNILVDGEPFPAKELVIFTLMKDTTIHFEYEAIPVEVKRYTVYTAAEQGGTVDKSETKVTAQDTFTAIAAPDSTHTFVRWKDVKGTTISTSPTLVLTNIDSDRCYIAEFTEIKAPSITYYKVFASSTAGGTIPKYDARVAEGESLTLTAVPDEGYRFLGWYKGGNKVSSTSPYTFNVYEDTTLVARFERIPKEPEEPKFTPVTFTAVSSNERMGTIDKPSVTINSATETGTFTAIPNTGYRLKQWVNAETKHVVSVDNPMTVAYGNILHYEAVFTPNYTSIFDEEKTSRVVGNIANLPNECHSDGEGGVYTQTVYATPGIPFKSATASEGTVVTLSEDKMSATITLTCSTLKGELPTIEIVNVDDAVGTVMLDAFKDPMPPKEPDYTELTFAPVEGDIEVNTATKEILLTNKCVVGEEGTHTVRIPYTGDLKEIRNVVASGVTIRKEDNMVIITYICKLLSGFAHTLGKIFGFVDGDEWTVKINEKQPATPKYRNLTVRLGDGVNSFYYKGDHYSSIQQFEVEVGTSVLVRQGTPEEGYKAGQDTEFVMPDEDKEVVLTAIPVDNNRALVTIQVVGPSRGLYVTSNTTGDEVITTEKTFITERGAVVEVTGNNTANPHYEFKEPFKQVTITEDTTIVMEVIKKVKKGTSELTVEYDDTMGDVSFEAVSNPSEDLLKLMKNSTVDEDKPLPLTVNGPLLFFYAGYSRGGHTHHQYRYYDKADGNELVKPTYPKFNAIKLSENVFAELDWMEVYEGNGAYADKLIMRLDASKTAYLNVEDPNNKLNKKQGQYVYLPYDMTLVTEPLKTNIIPNLNQYIENDDYYEWSFNNGDSNVGDWLAGRTYVTRAITAATTPYIFTIRVKAIDSDEVAEGMITIPVNTTKLNAGVYMKPAGSSGGYNDSQYIPKLVIR